ncbi:MAG: ABC transporter ATP-binding protein [Phycisphaeraceae bacterium]|nr:ABC transporter ATP-binding protein [Phycisphaeraceae bacterium]
MSDETALSDKVARRLDLKLWARILRFARPYRRTLVGLGFAALGIATIDAGMPILIKHVIDLLAEGASFSSILPFALIYLLMAIVFCVGIYGFVSLGGRIAANMAHDIRQAAFNHLQELGFNFFDHHNVGWLMARLTGDTDRLARIIGWALLDLLWGGCLLIAVAVMMLILDWYVAGAVLLVIPLLVWVSGYFQRRILVSHREARRINSLLTAEYNEGISGIRTTKTLARERDHLERFMVQSRAMYEVSRRHALQTAMYLPIVLVLVSLGEAMAIFLGSGRVLAGVMTLGTLVSFSYYAKLLPVPIRETARNLTEMLAAQAAAERVVQLLDTTPDIVDSPDVQARIAAHAASPQARSPDHADDGLPDRIEHVRFEQVSFAYRHDEWVLRDLDLEAHRGQSIALVGPTGGGKTTIISLLARFYEPSRGRILLDGTDYRQRSLAWLQSRQGVVLQSPQLFTGTIRENIRYGMLDATDERIEEAARLVGAMDFIEQLDEGLDAPVGQGGNRLSTGQRQLVSFARAVLGDPPILIMDEATSSIDTQTEQIIQRAMSVLLAGRISFIIAHRLSTIRNATQIVVIDKGRIVEQGDHRGLLARRGRYHKLYTGQFNRLRTAELLHTNDASDPPNA